MCVCHSDEVMKEADANGILVGESVFRTAKL